MHVASIPTCSSANYLAAATHRDEVWVHCWNYQTSLGDDGHLDIFSTNVLGLDHQQVYLDRTTAGMNFGLVRISPSVPNYAYATMLFAPGLIKVDVNTRETTTLWLNS